MHLMHENTLLDAFRPHLVADASFAHAYDRVAEADRALLKACAAALFEIYPPLHTLRRVSSRHLASGTLHLGEQHPRPWVVVRADASTPPAHLLAALLPARTGRVASVLVAVCAEAGAVPDATLCALELAGQEDVLVLAPQQADELVCTLTKYDPRGMLLDVATSLEPLSSPPAARWRVDGPARIGVLADGDDEPDHAAIALCHAGANVSTCNGDLDTFLARRFDCAIVPERMLQEVAPHYPLTLTTGMEYLWYYPELEHNRFLCSRAGFAPAS